MNKSATEKYRKCNVNAVGLLLLTIDFDIYTESGSINYCLCTVLVSCTVMHSFLVKRYVYTSLVKKDIQPIMSTSRYLRPGFSYLRNSVCLIVVTWMPQYLWFNSCALFSSVFLMLQAPRYLNPALVRGAWNKGQLLKRGVVENRLRTTGIRYDSNLINIKVDNNTKHLKTRLFGSKQNL